MKTFILIFLGLNACTFNPAPFQCEKGEKNTTQKCVRGEWVTNQETPDLGSAEDAEDVYIPACGNGILDTGEECEDAQVTQSCRSLGRGPGKVECIDCRLSLLKCSVLETCGNGDLDEDEVCEDENLGQHTCQSEGFDAGTLGCQDCALDTRPCSTCGDRVLDPETELCDDDLFGTTCEERLGAGYSGDLKCDACQRVDDSFCKLTYVFVSAGDAHTCALLSDNSIRCWGNNADGQRDAPTGAFKSLSAGSQHNCAIRRSGETVCWGRNEEGQTNIPDGRYKQISAGGFHTCAINMSDKIKCWGANNEGQAQVPNFLQNSAVSQITSGGFETCVLLFDKSVRCWGIRGDEVGSDEAFLAVSSGAFHSCGLREDGSILCDGNDEFNQSSDLLGPFAQLETGDFHNCALTSSGEVQCWGLDEDGQSSAGQLGPLIQVSAGGAHSCGVNNEGSILCWGLNSSNQSFPPAL